MMVAEFGKVCQVSFIGKLAVYSTATDLCSTDTGILINSVSYNADD